MGVHKTSSKKKNVLVLFKCTLSKYLARFKSSPSAH